MTSFNTYHVHAIEPGPPPPELANLDELTFEPPPCPLCGSAYVAIMAHGGPTTKWLECFLGHCVEVHGDAEDGCTECGVVDKPRYIVTMALTNFVAMAAT